MCTTLERLGREAREIGRGKLNRLARSDIRCEFAQKFRRYHMHHKPLIKTTVIHFFGVPFANGTPKALWLRPVRERDAEGITLFFRLSNLIVKRSPLFLMDNHTV